MRLEPGSFIDRYEIVTLLGEGAYARTYKARDPRGGGFVVLKVPNPTLVADPAIFGRFRRESEIVRTLDHPGIVRSLDDGFTRSEPYLVLEYIDGENFRRRLGSFEGPVPIELALRWGKELASVLVYMHQHGIVHRDLKPENILVNADDRLKVIDFGTALIEGAKRLTWRHLTENLGTPDYMSPEQIQGERGDERSDMYAWGIMMYEFLTGRVPFGGDNWMAVMAGHLTKNPEPIRKRNPRVPPALEAVVLKAMRRYPEHRYADPSALLADLDALDALDPGSFDLSPEPPMGGIGSVQSSKQIWMLIAIVTAVCVVLAAIIIVLAVTL
ncbi:MAG TPA: serine/threonine-protein kinase [Acidimicrobiia bacterium]|nr:serine/threonine-protein kinase [Acidimicrobiia bacterium]